ncbi:MAG: ThuA domain-containing protein [Bacteroidota bacterium]
MKVSLIAFLLTTCFGLTLLAQKNIAILNFQADNGFQHSSKLKALSMVEKICKQNNWHVVSSIDTAYLDSDNLQQFDVIVFNNMCGNEGRIFSTQQQKAIQAFIRNGGGFVGIHCAGAIWQEDGAFQDWYEKLIGTRLVDHPQVEKARLILENKYSFWTNTFPKEWVIEDEWHRFAYNPRPYVNVLLSLDENSYDGKQKLGGDHPFTWYQYFDGGRSFFTAIGHSNAIYEDANFQELVKRGIYWASGKAPDIFGVPVTAGLLLDLDANHGINLEDGDRVISWQNQAPSSNVKDFVKQDIGRTPAGSGRPTLQKKSVNAGENNTVVFHQQELVNDDDCAFDHLTTGSGYTWFSVMAVNTQTPHVPGVNAFFGNLRNSNVNNQGNYEGFWAGLSDDNKVWMGTRNALSFGRWDENNPLVIDSRPLTKGQYYVVMGRMGAGREKAKLELFINNTLPVSEALIRVNTSADPAVMAIGQERDASNHPGNESFDGEISRFLIFERPLSAHEMTQVLAYLKEKYRIK